MTVLDYKRIAEVGLHPTQVKILDLYARNGDLEWSPKAAANVIGVSLGCTAYHFRRLVASGLLRQSRRDQVRGAARHHYRLTAKAKAEVVK